MLSATLARPWELPLLLALTLLLTPVVFPSSAHAAASGQELFALDGFGHPVAWWAVLKLPMHVRAVDTDDSDDGDGENKSHVRPTPCDCAAPDCANAPTASLNVDARATGLCYLYADANHPAFQHFRALGYDCLGQGGNDPVSHTLRQLRPAATQDSEQEQEPYWAIFNDQLNGIARDYKPPVSLSPLEAPPIQQQQQQQRLHQHGRSGAICGGGNLFSAHAKGAVGFRSDSGGFFLQTSTPNFPDPTSVTSSTPNNNSNGKDDDTAVPFVRLGCQVDNNVHFAQHLFAMSLDMEQLETLGTQLQVARLCSGNFYTGGSSMDGLKELLASQALYTDGMNASANGNFSGLYDALLNPLLPEREQSATLNLTLKRIPAKKRIHKKQSSVYVESMLSLADLNSQLQHEDTIREYGPQIEDNDGPEVVHVIVKSPKAAVPPWALVAESLETDISVASWWDGSYGIPNICAGDDYSHTSNQFCLANDAHDVHLVSANGTARFNIENLVQATWKLPNDSLTWHLIGGQEPGGNHAKWALTSPRDRKLGSEAAFVTFADLNMEGFPCSSTCNGSQAGRGGSFFSLPSAELHASVAQSIVSKACRCTSGRSTSSTSWDPDTDHEMSTDGRRKRTPSHHGKRDARRSHDGGDGAETPEAADEEEARDSFVDARMCHFGCWRKVAARFTVEELPRLAPNASSFWPE